MSDFAAQIAENVSRVRDRMAAAAERSGRRPDSIRLVAVTKYVTDDWTRAVLNTGCHDLGESRPQDLWKKAGQIIDPAIRWHLIGHLQRNKVRRVLPHVSWLHSGDSERLLEAVNECAGELSRRLPVLLEVNVSGDSSKHGFRPDELESLVPRLARFQNLEVRGLMAMSGLESDELQTQREFSAVRQLQERLVGLCPESMQLRELSMGMSGDFEIAIAEGATLVRVGSALFAGIQP